jgi:hypothetical protein
MAKLVIGGRESKSAQEAIVDALPGILGYARAKFRGHPDMERILADVQNHAWKYVARKWQPGRPLPIDLNLLCKMAAGDYGIEGGNRKRKRLKVRNDSRLLNRLKARQAKEVLELDVQEALDKLDGLQKQILSMLIQSYKWSEICETLKTNVWQIWTARQELGQLLQDYR